MERSRRMHPVVFTLALMTVLSLTVALGTAGSDDPAQLAGAASGGLVLVSMIWSRGSGRSDAGPWRLAAAAGALLLAGVVASWWPREDLFMIHRSGCAPRVGTFWSLVFVWLAGAALQTVASGAPLTKPLDRAHAPAWRHGGRLLVLLAWTFACGEVFLRNINAPVWRNSLLGPVRIIGVMVAAALVLVLPIAWLARSGDKRRRAARADYAAIDDDTRRALLDMIDRHARTGAFRLMYRRAGRLTAATSPAHIGGSPLDRPNEPWPTDDEQVPAVFLLQLPLVGIGAPVWERRLLVIYLIQHELLVRSHAAIDGLVPRQATVDPGEVEPVALQPLALPLPAAPLPAPPADEDEDGLDPAWLVDAVPGLRTELAALTHHPAQVLQLLLTDDAADLDGAVLVGGTPCLIQNAHDPRCEVCAQPMRFLMQFGDVTRSMAMGDCGTGYVYGCDHHPGHCQAFVDCY